MRMICAQTREPGVSASQLAKDPKFRALPDDADATTFLPAGVVDAVSAGALAPGEQDEMRIDVASGHRLTVKCSFCPDALALLI